MADFDLLVVGAGVVGLACARAAATAGARVLIAERDEIIGGGISSRNSEVIHAGLYYPPGSLKARLCLAGRDRLYAYALEHGVPHAQVGKLIVATDAGQLCALDRIRDNAFANGVSDLQLISKVRMGSLEPALAGMAALHSPATGIIDSHAYMYALLGEAEGHGAQLALNAEITRLERAGGVWHAWVAGSEDPAATSTAVINAAGLDATSTARQIVGYDPRFHRRTHYARGNYFAYQGPVPFKRLIYPVPEPGGLGIHLTLDLAGRARFGPDVQWSDAPDLDVDETRQPRFVTAIRRYWPDIDPDKLVPDFVGIRPKLVAAEGRDQDFLLEDAAQHGLDRLVNLYGIESPGLTSSLALGEMAAGLALG